MRLSSRSPLLVLPALAALALLTGCEHSSSTAAGAPARATSAAGALEVGRASVNGLADEQETEAARLAAEAEAARIAAEAEVARAAAEAEAARVAAEQRSAAAASRPSGATSIQRSPASPRPSTMAAPAPAPAAVPSGDLVLSNMSCHWDGGAFVLGFTASFESGQHYKTINGLRNPQMPFLTSLDGHHVIGGNFEPYGNCGD